MKTCPICGRDDLKHQGALNMHMYHCKMKNSSVPSSAIKKDEIVQENDVCTHEWRFLNLKQPIEKKAFENGYVEVCKKCQDLKGYDE